MSVAGYISYKQSAASLLKAVEDNLRGEAASLQRMTNNVLESTKNTVELIGNEQHIAEFFSGDIQDKARGLALSGWLDRRVKFYNDIDRVNVFNMNGDIIASSNTEVIGSNFKTRDYFMVASQNQTFVSAPLISRITNKGMIIISAPITIQDKVVGVINANVSLSHYFDTVIAPVRVGERGYAYAIDNKGQIVAHKNENWLFKDDLPATPSLKTMAEEKDGPIEFKNNEGKECFAYHAKDDFSGMTVVVQSEKEDIFAELNQLTRSSILIVVISIILGVVVLLLIVRPIVSIINRSAAFASEVAAGHLDGVLDVDENRKDEIGVLAHSLRAIPQSLNAIIAEYRRLEEELVYGKIEIMGNASQFSGDFARLVDGTNAMLSRYQLILNALASPVIMMDQNLRLIFINDAGKAIAGDNTIGKTCGEVMAREDFNTPECALHKAANTLRPATAETAAHPRGKRYDITYTALPMLDKAGKLAAVLQVITDLTAIKSTQRTIIEVANKAQEISNSVASASEELSAQVEQVKHGADVQRSRATSTAAAMEEMNSTVMEVARNAGDANQQAESTRSKAEEGADLVRQVMSAIGQVNSVAEELEKNMQQLGAQAESISSVMNMISDIADQTNLLALNAAIEAARAGEAGRGFAVVADEVRKLAEKTVNATTEVGTSIKGIQSATTINIERVGNAANEVANATKLASVSEKALGEILQLVNTNSSLINSIAAAAEEQAATSEEINKSVDDINRIAGETAAGMDESSKAVHELSRMAHELKTLLDRLNQ
ncbi:MAG: methyl-accepting chemotaxis protein [Syntrophorhabdaceae bacterium]|nr:methyl-accepting chemotaxis protein [Syntrophorhabdaceae bacterium]